MALSLPRLLPLCSSPSKVSSRRDSTPFLPPFILQLAYLAYRRNNSVPTPLYRAPSAPSILRISGRFMNLKTTSAISPGFVRRGNSAALARVCEHARWYTSLVFPFVRGFHDRFEIDLSPTKIWELFSYFSSYMFKDFSKRSLRNDNKTLFFIQF